MISPHIGLGSSRTTLTLLEGSTFCISERVGDIVPDRAQGLVVRDTRILSRWQLTVDGVSPVLLTVEGDEPFVGMCVSRIPAEGGLADSTVLVTRRRAVGDGMWEDITLHNTCAETRVVSVDLAVAADFADLFEVKEGRADVDGEMGVVVGAGVLRLSRERRGHASAVEITAEGATEMRPDGLHWRVQLDGHARRSLQVQVTPVFDGVRLEPRHSADRPVEHALPMRRLHSWRQTRPAVETPDIVLTETLRRSAEDLGVLRIFDPAHPERAVVAAGAPWYMALFGRDALLTAWMVLPLDTGLALSTLQTLADHQGERVDDDTEEQPGRILHEIRFGPATAGRRARGVYYGTVDATPLFVALLGEVARWVGVDDRVLGLLPHADRALEWIVGPGDPDGDGFVEYDRSSPSGLANQGWKDSWDGITYADGRIAESPIALAEVQGYCYAAMRARAEFAQRLGDLDLARAWGERADALKRRFNEVFWLSERGWYALALGPDKEPVDALASNMGHCLWSGIVDDDKAPEVARHLVSAELFNGWGIRTLGRSMPAYNAMSYHNGSVWPHDTALCVAGLMRYGFVAEAQRVALAMLDAAARFTHRLPELFCGFDREEFTAPVPYPASCSPQAWSAAAPVHLLRTLLRFDPDVPAGRLHCAPALPDRLLPLTMRGVRVGAHDVRVDVDADGVRVVVGDGADHGLTVIGEPARGERPERRTSA